MREQAILIGKTKSLVGVVTTPPDAVPPESTSRQRPAIVLLNAGIVHRVGPGRLYVKLARRLAELGFVVVRFDASGLGDSAVRRDNLPHDKSSILETVEAMDYLAAEHGVDRFVLMGICSGAVTCFTTACADQRVAGAVLMNARGFDYNAEWNTFVMSRGWARDYWRRLLSPRSWIRVLTGKSQYRRFLAVVLLRIKNLFQRSQAVSAVATGLGSDLNALIERDVRLLLVSSQGDHSADYLNAMMGERAKDLRRSGAVQEECIAGSDHTFTCLKHQQEVLNAVEAWATRWWPGSEAATAPVRDECTEQLQRTTP